MSRELILIPKVRYETLIKNEKDQSRDKEVKNEDFEEHSLKNEAIPPIDLNKTQINNEIGNYTKPKHVDVDLNQPRKSTKIQDMSTEINKNQLGGGKSYIKMMPKELLNIEN